MNARVFTAPWSKTAAQVLLVLAVLLAYGNSLELPFLFDDRAAILDNPSIRELGSLGEILSPPANGSAVAGRPVVNLSLAFNYAWSGTSPWSYHLFNITVHALAGLLLFGVVRRTLISRIRTEPLVTDMAEAGAADPLLLSFLVALLWLLHPLQTESVTCVVQRTESLCGFFFLLTLYGFIRGWELQAESSHDQKAPKLRATLWYAVSVLACLLGMGTKEVMVTAPVMVWLYDRSFVTGGFIDAWRRRRGYYLALLCTWVLLACLVFAGKGTRGSAAGFGVGMSSWAYALKQCEALVLYLKLSFWPHPLVLDYGTAVPNSLAELWWQACVVVGLLALTVWALVKKPALGFAGAWFFVILAPSSSVVPLAAQTMAEHRMYLPLFAPIALFTMSTYLVGGRRMIIAFFLIAVAFGVMTWRRNAVYQSELRLWSDTAESYPSNSRAFTNLGNAFLDADRLSEAQAAYQSAERLNPKSPELQANLCLSCTRLGRLQEALAHGEEALRLDPAYTNAHVNLANALLRLGQTGEAIKHFQAALRLQPEAFDLHLDLGGALLEAGRADEAISHLEAALPLVARRGEIHRKLAQAFVGKGDLAAAKGHAAKAMELNPNDAETLFVWGNLCASSEDFVAAIAAFRRAVELVPDYAVARNNLANALLVSGQVDAAITEYREVLKQRPNDPFVQENLQQALELKASAGLKP